jgi:hypothetical protein
VVGGGWRSTLSVVNLDPTPGNVTFEFFSNNGTPIGGIQERPILGRGKIYITDQDFFSRAGSQIQEGYLKITSTGPKLAGSVVFGDLGRSTFASSLPLVSTLQSAVVYSQFVSNATYYTGLAILNPSDIEANAMIEVRDENGNLVAAKVENIPARQRKSQVLTEYFPQLVGQNLNRGYIKLLVDRSVASFALYGTRTDSVLSAVPPQVIP